MNLLKALIEAPWYQIPIFLSLTILLLTFLRTSNANSVWTITGGIYAVFILTNSFLVWGTESPWIYLGISILCSFGYLLLAGWVASVCIKWRKMNGSGESAMLFLIIIYHPVLLVILILARILFRYVTKS